jgi:hypothetical protein
MRLFCVSPVSEAYNTFGLLAEEEKIFKWR